MKPEGLQRKRCVAMRPGHICDASPVAIVPTEENLLWHHEDGLAEAMLVANRWSLQVLKSFLVLRFERLISFFSVISGRAAKEPSGELWVSIEMASFLSIS